MSPARAGVFVGLFLLLVAAYFGLEWRSRQVERREEKAKRVFDISVEDATSATVERPGEPAVRLVKAEDGQWRIAAPIDARADQDAARRLVLSVAEAQRDRALDEPGADLAKYGLDRPTATVTLETRAGQRRLAVGGDAPIGGAAYARAGDAGPVLLVASQVKADATQSLFELRSKRIVDVAEADLRRVEVRPPRTPGQAVILVKQGDGWRLEGAPAGRDLIPAKVDRLVRTVGELRMSKVVSEDRSGAKAHGLEPPARTVTLGLASGTGPTVQIGAPVAERERNSTAVAVAGRPGVFLVDTVSLEPLDWKPGDLLAPPPTPTPSPPRSPSSPPAGAAASPPR